MPIYIDESNGKQIDDFIEGYKETFNMVVWNAVRGIYDGRFYEKLWDDLTEMKFKGKNVNPRIYCREIKNGRKKIVMIELLPHKNKQKIDKKIDRRLTAISKYQFTFDEKCFKDEKQEE